MLTGGCVILSAASGGLISMLPYGCSQQEEAVTASRSIQPAQVANLEKIKLTILYDNVPYQKGLRKDWGFACLVEGLEKTLLFDAGRYDDLFMANLAALKVEPEQIDALFISHDHPDHIGGSLKLLGLRPQIDVALVDSFRSGYKKRVRKAGAVLTEIDQPQVVFGDCLSTGEMKSAVKREHALVIPTDEGAILITGCAHPGVVEMAARAKKISGQEVLLVAGGFHLMMDSGASIQKIAAQLKELGVRYLAPSHCSGGEALKILANLYGNRFLKSGLGRCITAEDLA
jgi:7,8-dihydropterin-6-yl-methyl-4-(beta-D-ribofuranosyl)aminobenzene 5'-phosphate synthase